MTSMESVNDEMARINKALTETLETITLTKRGDLDLKEVTKMQLVIANDLLVVMSKVAHFVAPVLNEL